MKKIRPYLYIAIAVALIISFMGKNGEMVENLQIPVGIGYDLEGTPTNLEYRVPMLVKNTQDGEKKISYVVTGRGRNMGSTRETRQLISDKKFMLGLNKVFLYSENAARIGLRPAIDILINNPTINDRGICVICKEKTEDILKYKVNRYLNSPEFIEGMVKNAIQFNFFSKQYSVIDVIARIDSEGRSILLPYIEIKQDGIELTGLAIFKGDKLVTTIDMKEAKIVNLLKESNVKGILSIQNDSRKYVSCYTTSKRKTKCYKKDGKYSFIINLDLKGQLTANTLNKDITKNSKELHIFEEAMKDDMEKRCNEMISKLKCEYKVDFLELGRLAAAKYGRGTGVDWNEVICNSEIKVIVKFSLDTEGRGNY